MNTNLSMEHLTWEEFESFLSSHPEYDPHVDNDFIVRDQRTNKVRSISLSIFRMAIARLNRYDDSIFLEKLVEKYGADRLNQPLYDKDTPLLYYIKTCSCNDWDSLKTVIKKLHDLGCDINLETGGLTPLALAACKYAISFTAQKQDFDNVCRLLITLGGKYFAQSFKRDDIEAKAYSYIESFNSERCKRSLSFYTLQKVEDEPNCFFSNFPNELMFIIAEKAGLATPNNFSIFKR